MRIRVVPKIESSILGSKMGIFLLTIEVNTKYK